MSCKWDRVSEEELNFKSEMDYWYPECRKRFVQVAIYENVLSAFKYCPYCGRRIESLAKPKEQKE